MRPQDLDKAPGDGGGWIGPHRNERERMRHAASKRPFEGSSEGSGGSVSYGSKSASASRRPVARYRRSYGPDDGATASASADLTLGGSYDSPIELLSPDGGGGLRAKSTNEVINLEAEVGEGGASGASGGASDINSLRTQAGPSLSLEAGMSSHRRASDFSEPPAAKRICNVAEPAAPLNNEVQAVAIGGARPRSVFRRWTNRERVRQPVHHTRVAGEAVNAAAPSVVVEPRDVTRLVNVNRDERFAQRLHEAYVAEAASISTDAQLARSLQEQEGLRHFRMPMHIDPRVYLRQIERARMRGNYASNSRQNEAARHRQLRRLRAADIEERLNVLGAMLHGQLPLAMQLEYIDRDFNENDYEMLLALDDTVKPIGAPQSKIDELPVTKAQSKEKDECSICLEKPESGDQMRRLPCSHAFHQKCIDSWLHRRANCPVCKAEI